MAITYELSAKSGTYTDKQGNEKNSYTRCGVVMETRKGPMIKLEALPINFDGWLYMNEPKAKDDPKPAKAKREPGSDDDFDESLIPF